VPSGALLPDSATLGNLDAGLAGRIGLGIGLTHQLELRAEAGVARATGNACNDCAVTSIDGGAGMVFHLAQGLAIDPWVAYGMAYRSNQVNIGDQSFGAFEFTRLALGADFFPIPSIGFGPYIGADFGVRTSGESEAYGAFQLGMRVAFDPMRAGASAAPPRASAKR
jgi:hypothetical protein